MSVKRTAASTLAGLLVAGFAALANAPPAIAQETADTATSSSLASDAVKYANGVYLAYVNTSSDSINRDSQRGLTALNEELTTKTSLDPDGIVAIDIENDDISFFNFIYWPVTTADTPLSEEAQRKVQRHIDSGGIIMFDLSDTSTTLENPESLRRLLGDVNLEALVEMPADHTLTRTFFLTDSIPGSRNNEPVWIQAADPHDQEDVTAVIVGNRSWARAWAGLTVSPTSESYSRVIQGGINAVLYAYSGNYKGDQFNIQNTLERLQPRGQ